MSKGLPGITKWKIHGLSESTEYSSWESMKSRCYYEKGLLYQNYGGRGIKVCERWKNSFTHFLEDMGNKPTLEHTLDRIDVNKDYSPENCRWATRSEQDRNRTDNVFIEHNGQRKIITDWAREKGLTPNCILYRIKNWGVEKALTLPAHSRNRK